MIGQDWRGQDRTGQDRTGQDWTGQDWTGHDWTGQNETRQDWPEKDNRPGQKRTEKDILEDVWIQGVPHQFGSFMALNCVFRDKSKNLERLNQFKKLYKPNIKI